MTNFVHVRGMTDLNLAHVTMIVCRQRTVKDEDGKDCREDYHVAFDTTGAEHEIVGADFDADAFNYTIVPVIRPLTLLCVWLDNDNRYQFYRVPIIAWRISPTGAYPEPIAPGIDPGDETQDYFIELADDDIVTGWGIHFATVDEAIEYVRKRDDTAETIMKEITS